MMQVHWRLRDYLNQHGLTAYRLAKVLPEVRQPTIYRLASEHSPQSVNFETLGKVLQGLKTLTGEEVTPNDLLEVIQVSPLPEREPALLSGSLHKWIKRAPQPPFVEGLDSTVLVAEARRE